MPGSPEEAGDMAEAYLQEEIRHGIRVGRREDDGSILFGRAVELVDGSLGVRFDGSMSDTVVESGDMKAYRLTWLLSDAALEVEPDASMKLRRSLQRDNVVIYDTTHATSRFGLKLGCFVIVGSDMRTKIIAISLVTCEDKESFEWVFSAFLKAFHFAPSVIFTDGDAAMKAAIISVFPESKHLLCIFHLSLNLSKHFRGLLGARYREFSRRFWIICLETEVSSRESFDAEWDSFTSMAEAVRSETNEKKLDQALLWLKAFGERREQWAARWTWAICTYGVRSTQRSEATHSAIKQFLRASGLITELLAQLTEYSLQTQQEQRTAEHRKQLRVPAVHGVPKIIADMVTSLTPAAFDVLKEQSMLAGIYYIRDIAGMPNAWRVYFAPDSGGDDGSSLLSTEEGDNQFASSVEEGRTHKLNGHVTTLHHCSCQFPSMRGIPCRHIIKVHIHVQCTRLHFVFAPLWRNVSESDLHARARSMSLMPFAGRKTSDRSRVMETLEDHRGRLQPIYRHIVDAIRTPETCAFVETKLRQLMCDVRVRDCSTAEGDGTVVHSVSSSAMTLANPNARQTRRVKRIKNAGM